jgi:hypothetical protein
VVRAILNSAVLGPTRKVLLLSALKREIQQASAETAQAIISQAMSVSAEQSLDAALFGTAAVTDTAPAGLLNGVTPISATGGSCGVNIIASDLGNLAQAISTVSNSDDMIIVTTPQLATKVLSSSKFTNVVMSSVSIPQGQVIALLPKAVAIGYAGNVMIDISAAAPRPVLRVLGQ